MSLSTFVCAATDALGNVPLLVWNVLQRSADAELDECTTALTLLVFLKHHHPLFKALYDHSERPENMRLHALVVAGLIATLQRTEPELSPFSVVPFPGSRCLALNALPAGPERSCAALSGLHTVVVACACCHRGLCDGGNHIRTLAVLALRGGDSGIESSASEADARRLTMIKKQERRSRKKMELRNDLRSELPFVCV